jgi:hypothetical protein
MGMLMPTYYNRPQLHSYLLDPFLLATNILAKIFKKVDADNDVPILTECSSTHLKFRPPFDELKKRAIYSPSPLE